MPEFTDLKAEIAACWKVFWNDDPLPFSVPLPAAADDDVAPPPAVGLVPPPADVVELDEEHAASSAIARTAPPAVTACFLPRSCMTNFLLLVIGHRTCGGLCHQRPKYSLPTWMTSI